MWPDHALIASIGGALRGRRGRRSAAGRGPVSANLGCPRHVRTRRSRRCRNTSKWWCAGAGNTARARDPEADAQHHRCPQPARQGQAYIPAINSITSVNLDRSRLKPSIDGRAIYGGPRGQADRPGAIGGLWPFRGRRHPPHGATASAVATGNVQVCTAMTPAIVRDRERLDGQGHLASTSTAPRSRRVGTATSPGEDRSGRLHIACEDAAPGRPTQFVNGVRALRR